MNKKKILLLESIELSKDNDIEALLILLLSEVLKDKPEFAFYLWCEGVINSDDFEIINSQDETGNTTEIVPVVNYDYKRIYAQFLILKY